MEEAFENAMAQVSNPADIENRISDIGFFKKDLFSLVDFQFLKALPVRD